MEEEYRQKRREIIQRMKEKEEMRKKFRDDTAIAVKQVMKATPLYKVIEQKYKEEVEMPELNEKKQKLKNLRNFYKPVHKLNINAHSKNYELIKKQMENDIKR